MDGLCVAKSFLGIPIVGQVYPKTENNQRIGMKHIGIPHNTEMSPFSWDIVERYFYEDEGLIHIDTEAVIRHLVNRKDNNEENRPEEKWDGPKLSC